jgi:hypothetical protein
MEPVEWFIGLVLLFGGAELWERNNSAEHVNNTDREIVSAEPVYTKGRYFLSDQGYYITDLSSEPSQEVECNDTANAADQPVSNSVSEDGSVVDGVIVGCGG